MKPPAGRSHCCWNLQLHLLVCWWSVRHKQGCSWMVEYFRTFQVQISKNAYLWLRPLPLYSLLASCFSLSSCFDTVSRCQFQLLRPPYKWLKPLISVRWYGPQWKIDLGDEKEKGQIAEERTGGKRSGWKKKKEWVAGSERSVRGRGGGGRRWQGIRKLILMLQNAEGKRGNCSFAPFYQKYQSLQTDFVISKASNAEKASFPSHPPPFWWEQLFTSEKLRVFSSRLSSN